MEYHNVEEIFVGLQATRQQLYQRVKELSSAQANFKSASDTWSVAEILEHLNKTEQQIAKRFKEQLPVPNPGNNTVPVQFAPFSMDSYVETTRDRKLKSPEFLLPAGDLPVSALLQRLRASRDELLALRPRFEAHDLSQIFSPHPVCGQVNPYQALAFAGLHENRHLRQIEAIMASPGFPQI